jgi:hypothetical protein
MSITHIYMYLHSHTITVEGDIIIAKKITPEQVSTLERHAQLGKTEL